MTTSGKDCQTGGASLARNVRVRERRLVPLPLTLLRNVLIRRGPAKFFFGHWPCPVRQKKNPFAAPSPARSPRQFGAPNCLPIGPIVKTLSRCENGIANDERCLTLSGDGSLHFARPPSRPALQISAGIVPAFAVCTQGGKAAHSPVAASNRPDRYRNTPQIILTWGCLRSQSNQVKLY